MVLDFISRGCFRHIALQEPSVSPVVERGLMASLQLCKIVEDQEAALKQPSEALEVIAFSRRMLALKDSLIETLGTSRTANIQRVDDLKKENRELRERLNSVQ